MAQITKFGRRFKLDLYLASGEHIVINNPLTVTFNIQRATLACAQTGSITLYNLKESTRRMIYHDRYDIKTYSQVILAAGYGDLLPIIFQGNMLQAYSYRQGVDWITQIECFGGYDICNGFYNGTFPQSYPIKQTITDIIKSSFSKATIGSIANFSGKTTDQNRGLTLSGNSWDIIQSINSNGLNFIDNEKVYCISQNEYVVTEGVNIITSSTGLLDTPRREETNIKLKILFEPNIAIGQVIEVQSLEGVNNGQYQVIGITHNGIISDAVGGQCTTTLTLWLGTQLLTQVAS